MTERRYRIPRRTAERLIIQAENRKWPGFVAKPDGWFFAGPYSIVIEPGTAKRWLVYKTEAGLLMAYHDLASLHYDAPNLSSEISKVESDLCVMLQDKR